MEKIAEGYYRKMETKYPSEGVTMDMAIDVIDMEELDTLVDISGKFCVAGSQRLEFIHKLGQLIDNYRI